MIGTISPPKFALQQQATIIPAHDSAWLSFEATIIERRHVPYKGWWYRVTDAAQSNTLGWVPETNLQVAQAALAGVG